MLTIDRLIEVMERGLLVPQIALSEDDIRTALNQRDDPAFAGPWMEVFRRVEQSKVRNRDADDRVTRLREAAYLQAYDRWHSADLAGYISDDFGLIGDALISNLSDSFLISLLDAYISKRFPTQLRAK